MDMSSAAIAPPSPIYSEKDREHPLFSLYHQHVTFCQIKMIRASDFRDWLYQYEMNRRNDAAVADPDYPAFKDWMWDTKGGARKCLPTPDMPYGLAFPHNFYYWKNGGRW